MICARPLAAIRAVAEALDDEIVTDPATISSYHRTLRAEAERLAELVDDLFELSRIHAGTLQLRHDVIDLGDLVSDAVAATTPAATARAVRLQGRVLGDTPLVLASAPELTRALRNLIDNAVRESGEGGAVRVETGVDAGDAWVRVADSCGGIAESELTRLFEAGYRGQAARSPGPSSGAGLGLAIAQGLVEAHDGTIGVRNVPGGCRFELRLPRLTVGTGETRETGDPARPVTSHV